MRLAGRVLQPISHRCYSVSPNCRHCRHCCRLRCSALRKSHGMECMLVGLVHCICEFWKAHASALDSAHPSRPHARRDLVGLRLVGSVPQPDGWPLPASLRELYFGESSNVTGPIPPGWRLPDSEPRMAALPGIASCLHAVPQQLHASSAPAPWALLLA